MKNKSFILVVAIAFVMASCSSIAEQISGTYSGTFSSNDLPVSAGTGTATVTAVGSNTVNITISSSGNPDVVISGAEVTKILSVYTFDEPSSASYTITGTVVGNIITITYDGNGTSISFTGP